MRTPSNRIRRLGIAVAVAAGLMVSLGIAAPVAAQTWRSGPAVTAQVDTSHWYCPITVIATAVTRHADGRAVMFAVDHEQFVWTRTQVAPGSDAWTGWSVFANTLTNIVAQTNGNGLIEVFGADSSGKVWHRWQTAANSESWSAWQGFGTMLSGARSAMTVTAAANGTLTFFAVDSNRGLWGRTQYAGANGGNGGGSWSPWLLMSGQIVSTVAAQTNGNGLIELFGADSTGLVWHRWELVHNTGIWSSWVPFGITLRPNAVFTATTMGPGGAVVVFAADVDTGRGRLWGRTEYDAGSNGGIWSPWTQIDGNVIAITAISRSDRRLELFGLNWGDLWHRKELAAGTGTWGPWEPQDCPIGP